MIIYSDSPDFTDSFFSQKLFWVESDEVSIESVDSLIRELFDSKKIFACIVPEISDWNILISIEKAKTSQFDVLNKLARKKEDLPDRILCLAGEGEKFHGFHSRPWQALKGNLHLSGFLKPNRPIDEIRMGFLVLSAVSVVQTIDEHKELENKSGIKWVNDIILKGSKVAGVLSQTQMTGYNVDSATIGIGMNIEASPDVVRDNFVPKAACLNDFLDEKTNYKDIFHTLIDRLAANYRLLLEDSYKTLQSQYKERSIVMNQEVLISTDPRENQESKIIREGKVIDIGEDLELFLDDKDEAQTSGRLIFKKDFK